MAKFTDSTGDEWSINLNVGLVEDIKERTTVDIDSVVQKPENLAEYLATEPRKLAAMLYILCEKQFDNKGLTVRDFAERLDRETLDKATNAFLEAVVTFYPRGSVGETLRDNLPQIIERMDKTAKMETQKKLDKLLSTPIG